MEVSFTAYEFQSDETFHKVKYRFQGSSEKGWEIFRNDQLFESLGSGYVLLKSLYCGICSTDIARANLPFPLPQITGHEVIALYLNKPVAVEINASHFSRGLRDFDCHYCDQGMSHHCPDRLTLGIDRLPGGFSPYLLAPQYSICPLPEGFNLEQSAVIEPLAAALHAVETSQINDGMNIAIVGPKRLGLLLILALSFYRKKSKLNFTINAVVRHEKLTETCLEFGADETLLVNNLNSREFDLVYDTSGSMSGFGLSLSIAKKTVHVKSTNGLAFGNFLHLTQMVIDEVSLMPLNSAEIDHLTSIMMDDNKNNILLDVGVSKEVAEWIMNKFPDKYVVQFDLDVADVENIHVILPDSGFKKFDVVFVSSVERLNKIFDFPGVGCLVRAKGDVYWQREDTVHISPWLTFFEKELNINTSRCGDFSKTIDTIDENLGLFSKIIPKYISGVYELDEINEAFDVARKDAASIKLVIKH